MCHWKRIKSLLVQTLKVRLIKIFAALIESEVIIPKVKFNNTSTVAINFHINNINFAKLLMEKLGYGSIQMDYFSPQALKFVILKIDKDLDIISLINDKFITLKINNLHTLIDYLDSKQTNLNIGNWLHRELL